MRLGQFTPQKKLLFHTDKVNRWLKGEDIYPILVEFDLTNCCTHRCNFCTFKYISDRSTLEAPVVKRTLADLSECGVKAVNWTGGGEPLLHKEFNSIAMLAHKYGLEQGLFTNGVALDQLGIHTILKTHKWVRFSVDAGNKKTYHRLRGANDFNLVMGNVSQMVHSRNLCGYQTQIGIGFVITPDNYKEIPQFSEWVQWSGADYGQFKPCINNYMEKQIEAKWWETKVLPLLTKAFKVNKKLVINLYKLNDLTSNIDREYKVCYGHAFCPCIGATGDVWLCTHMRDLQGYSMGNLHDNTFKEIWEAPLRQNIIKNINFDHCQFGCKNNEINKILYALKHPTPELHENFL